MRALLVGVIAVSGVLLLILRDPERRQRLRSVSAGGRLPVRLAKQALD